MKSIYIFLLFSLTALNIVNAQNPKLQQGIIYKQGASIRLGSIHVFNRHTQAHTKSNIYGVFSIIAAEGDTLAFDSPGFLAAKMVITDFRDQVLYMQQVTDLQEVVVKENSVKKELTDVQKVYRSKGVFYTGTPHYYYLLLKPMTFIYENFKGEVKNARKFKKYAAGELAYYEIARRFNDETIKSVVPVNDAELIDFKAAYIPTLQQYQAFNDYDLINYIKVSYDDFKKKKAPAKNPL